MTGDIAGNIASHILSRHSRTSSRRRCHVMPTTTQLTHSVGGKPLALLLAHSIRPSPSVWHERDLCPAWGAGSARCGLSTVRMIPRLVLVSPCYFQPHDQIPAASTGTVPVVPTVTVQYCTGTGAVLLLHAASPFSKKGKLCYRSISAKADPYRARKRKRNAILTNLT